MGLHGEVRRSVAGARLHIDHHHDELEFDLIVKGSGSLTLDDRNYVLKPGTLMWLMPGKPHRLVRSPGLEMWVVSLRPGLLDAAPVATLSERPLRLLSGQDLIDLDRLLSQVAQDSDDPAVYNAGIAYLAQRAWRASRDSRPARARPMHAAVTRALLLLRDSGASLSLSDLAEAAGVTAPYLSRLLIEHTGRSFVDWRNRIRLDRFMDAYRPGDNLLNAALDAGFGSYARFNHIFNDMIGCAPSEWVKRADPAVPDRDDDAKATAAPADYGMPPSSVLSARQRWTSMIPMLGPMAGALIGRFDPGKDPFAKSSPGSSFLDRLLRASPDHPVPLTEQGEPLETILSPIARQRLIASLQDCDPSVAGELAELMEAQDFADTYHRILDAFGLSAARLADGVTALVTLVWLAASGAADPGQSQVEAIGRQARSALGTTLARLHRRAAQDAYAMLLCHFVVIYRALEAARASGDDRISGQFRDAVVTYGREAFGGDVSALELTAHGLVHGNRSGNAKRTALKRITQKLSAARSM